jgi:hypothetical protein
VRYFEGSWSVGRVEEGEGSFEVLLVIGPYFELPFWIKFEHM